MKEQFLGQKEAMRKGVLQTLDTIFKYGVWSKCLKKETLLHLVDSESDLPKKEDEELMIMTGRNTAYVIKYKDGSYICCKRIV
jgi:hypothetical protein